MSRVWSDYLQAVQAISRPKLNFSALDELAWWDDLVKALDGNVKFIGDSEERSGSPTYTEERHQSMLGSLGLSGSAISRKDIMRAWIAKESGGLYWGAGKPEKTPYRMTEGGADERGSFGYNQILFTLTQYGMNKCSDIDGINLYHPKNNLLGQIAFASGKNGNCGRSLYLSFINSRKFHVKFSDAIDDGNIQLVGYGVRTASGEIKYIKTGREALEPDDYDRLSKGLAGYNGDQQRLYKCSLPDMVARENKTYSVRRNGTSFSVTSNCGNQFSGPNETIKEYAMAILHDGDNGMLQLPYRVYIWKTGSVCFAYGEEEWRSRHVIFRRYAQDVENGIKPTVICP